MCHKCVGKTTATIGVMEDELVFVQFEDGEPVSGVVIGPANEESFKFVEESIAAIRKQMKINEVPPSNKLQ